MHAYKVVGHVAEDRRVTVTLPTDFPVGDAEVIGLAAESESPEQAQRASLEAFFKQLDASPPSGHSNEDIDRYLEQERDNWDK